MARPARPSAQDAETARLDALHRYAVLDTAPEESFDRIVRLARATLGVPIAMISLIDRDRQWFKAHHGITARETPRDISFCSHVILRDTPMVVTDATNDPRFHDNPLVTGEPGIRFYLGAPLQTHDGHNIGAICAIDRVARTPTKEQLAVLQDLARLVMDELELRRLATTDSLTGAMTRLHFLEQSAKAIAVARRYGHPAGVLMLDVDHFKQINDSHGHPAGDMVLKQVVAVVRAELREVDMLGRLGGEEFAVFLPETDLDGTWEAAERLRTAVARQCFRYGDLAIPVTVSVGITTLAPEERDATAMLGRADIALYEAKESGRNRVMVAPNGTPPRMPAVA